MNKRPTFVLFPNPNGIESISPGLRGTSYPGLTDRDAPTPTGLRHAGRAKGCNPFRVDDVCFTVSQGSSCLATLGWMMESRWDSKTRVRQARDLEQNHRLQRGGDSGGVTMATKGMRKIKLKEVCDRITVGHVGPMADRCTAEGVPFLRSQNITAFRLNLDDIKFVPPGFHEKLRKSALQAGDVAVVRTGYPGTACVIPNTFTELNCADLVVITPSKELNPYYLAAIFNSAWGVASVAGNLVGVAQQHFNIGAAREMEVSLPPRPTQDRIAGILSAYDELMENSQRRIRLLDAMARALYREWFVHFRFPGHEKHPCLKWTSLATSC